MNKIKLFSGLLFIMAIMLSCKTDDVKPFVTLSTDVTYITENAGVATITASIKVASQNDIAVTLDTIGSMAKGDIDFTLIPTVIMIPAGSLSATAQLAAIPDNLKQGNQTVLITIKSIVGGSSDDNQKLTITILDDDIPQKKPPILVEDFDYPAGDLLTLHGWVIHSGSPNNPILVTSPGLTFAGYVGSNIGLAAGVNNTGIDENKSFGAQTKDSVYASFMVNVTATSVAGDYFFHFFDPNAVTSHRGRVFITPSTDVSKMKVGLTFSSATLPTNMLTELNFGETYLFVLKYTIKDALPDQVSLYVFKAGEDFSTEPTTPTIGPLTGSGADIVPTGVALRQFDAAQRITVDGIRVNTEWNLKP